MRTRLAVLIHYLAIFAAVALVMQPIIPHLNSGKTEELQKAILFLGTSSEWIKVEFTAIFLMIFADILCLIVQKTPKWMIGKKRDIDEFHEFINTNIMNGLTVEDCEEIIKSRNKKLNLKENSVGYYKLNDLGKGNTLNEISFSAVLYKRHTSFDVKAFRFISRFLQCVLLLVLSSLIGTNMIFNEKGDLWVWGLLILSLLYSFVTKIIHSNTIEPDIITENSQRFTYCCSCKTLMNENQLGYAGVSFEEGDFFAPNVKIEKTYKEKHVGTLEFSDDSRIDFYDTVVDEVTRTTNDVITKKYCCQRCGYDYLKVEYKEKKMTY